jgi:hypothetical protein
MLILVTTFYPKITPKTALRTIISAFLSKFGYEDALEDAGLGRAVLINHVK